MHHWHFDARAHICSCISQSQRFTIKYTMPRIVGTRRSRSTTALEKIDHHLASWPMQRRNQERTFSLVSSRRKLSGMLRILCKIRFATSHLDVPCWIRQVIELCNTFIRNAGQPIDLYFAFRCMSIDVITCKHSARLNSGADSSRLVLWAPRGCIEIAQLSSPDSCLYGRLSTNICAIQTL